VGGGTWLEGGFSEGTEECLWYLSQWPVESCEGGISVGGDRRIINRYFFKLGIIFWKDMWSRSIAKMGFQSCGSL